VLLHNNKNKPLILHGFPSYNQKDLNVAAGKLAGFFMPVMASIIRWGCHKPRECLLAKSMAHYPSFFE
jgi:hypothetical protein